MKPELWWVECLAGGDATAVAEALADEYSKASPGRKDTIATALASALDFSEEDANKALQGGAQNVAEAFATSRGGTTEAAARSVSEVGLLLVWVLFVKSSVKRKDCAICGGNTYPAYAARSVLGN